MFFGEYFHSLDEKGRIAIPSKCRTYASFVDGREIWYLTRGFEKCLMLFTGAAWNKIMQDKISGLSMGVREHRIFIRNFVSPAVEVQADKQGRIILPQHLREYSGITKDATILGAGKYIEIWDRKSYDIEQEENGNIDMIGDKLAELGL
ncbi:MAG: division/cell wall cluster transcriptional repressor MraZ [Spirochaetes bacterium]|nr:division/cell wall cluster transcriptional repressor MraZ [Spirochaetota bacterium]MCK5266540.1 division/cell wall cluster transcriptional repressor MraZ [Spirochaetota bacterium]